MAWESKIKEIPGATTNVDLSTGNGFNSTGQFLFAKIVGDDLYAPCTSKFDLPVGVIQNNPPLQTASPGAAVEIMCDGFSKVLVGAGGLVAGDEVGTDANGLAIKKQGTSTGANLGEYIVGVCHLGASAGALATIKLKGAVIV